jgi:hypothetical protein
MNAYDYVDLLRAAVLELDKLGRAAPSGRSALGDIELLYALEFIVEDRLPGPQYNPEWIEAEVARLFVGLVHAGLHYPTLEGEYRYVLEAVEATLEEAGL